MRLPMHADFLLSIGLQIFNYALFTENTSVEGALTLLAQAVMESGWDGSSTNYNLFGIMADRGEASNGSTAHGSVKDYTNDGKYQGSLEDYFSRLRRLWPTMIDVLDQETITYDDIDRGLNTGGHLATIADRHAGNYAYNYDLDAQGNNDYGTQMVNIRNSIRTRMIDALDYGISESDRIIDDGSNFLNAHPNNGQQNGHDTRIKIKLQIREARINKHYYQGIKGQINTTL